MRHRHLIYSMLGDWGAIIGWHIGFSLINFIFLRFYYVGSKLFHNFAVQGKRLILYEDTPLAPSQTLCLAYFIYYFPIVNANYYFEFSVLRSSL